jgi:hypothetical protein
VTIGGVLGIDAVDFANEDGRWLSIDGRVLLNLVGEVGDTPTETLQQILAHFGGAARSCH